VADPCAACGAPVDGTANDLCQECWEDWCACDFFESEAGLLPYSEERYQKWLEKRKEVSRG
jgi:hypothetical protein